MALVTSGTIGQTQIDVATVIDHSFRRCGKLPSTISGELLASARQNLFMIMYDLANRGLSLWCVQKYVLAITPGQTTFQLPTGTVDLLTALYRTSTTLTGTGVVSTASYTIDLGTAQTVNTVAVQFAAASSATLAIESSPDNITWTTELTYTISAAAGAMVYQDINVSPASEFWRVRDTSGTLATLTSVLFNNNPYEVTMSKISRDDYVNLPNKSFSSPAGTKTLQYWFDKQINPQIWVWPVAQGTVDQIVVWTQRQMQDVGLLTNALDIPQRWLESVIFTLACRNALELPSGELPPGRLEYLEAKAAEHLSRAEDGETDGAPIRLAPNIRGYTA